MEIVALDTPQRMTYTFYSNITELLPIIIHMIQLDIGLSLSDFCYLLNYLSILWNVRLMAFSKLFVKSSSAISWL